MIRPLSLIVNLIIIALNFCFLYFLNFTVTIRGTLFSPTVLTIFFIINTIILKEGVYRTIRCKKLHDESVSNLMIMVLCYTISLPTIIVFMITSLTFILNVKNPITNIPIYGLETSISCIALGCIGGYIKSIEKQM